MLRTCCSDSCPEVVVSVLCGVQYLVQNIPHDIHMVAESIIRMLEPLLSHRQRAVRLMAAKVISSLVVECRISVLSWSWTEIAMGLFLKISSPRCFAW